MNAVFLTRVTATIAVASAMLGGIAAGAQRTALPATQPALAVNQTEEHKIYGTVEAIRGHFLTIRTRTGRSVTVDGSVAHLSVALTANRPVFAFGTIDAGGVLHARGIWRTFPDQAHWPADR